MKRNYAFLDHVEADGPVTWDNDRAFLEALQTGLLLALKERGQLNEPECRCTVEALNRQRRDREAAE